MRIHGRAGGAVTGSQTLGAFGGVFTPGVLAVLGLVFFRRLGFVVGSTGLAWGLLMLALAGGIALLTSISLSAVATSRKARGTGDCFLPSRTLGIEFGGALGLALYLAQATSVAFYSVGFGEAAVALFGGSGLAVRLVAGGAAFAVFQLAYVGARLASRVAVRRPGDSGRRADVVPGRRPGGVGPVAAPAELVGGRRGAPVLGRSSPSSSRRWPASPSASARWET